MLKNIAWKKFVRRLRTFGFDGPYAGGRHLFMTRGALKVHIPNPHHGDITRGLLAEILRQAGIDFDEWNEK